MKYNTIVCGGTFDRFHKGHRMFLAYALGLGNKLVIGLTSDDYVKKLKITCLAGRRENEKLKIIEGFEERKQSILRFAEEEMNLDRVEIVKIEDMYGPTLSKDFACDAIVVSRDTQKGAEVINNKREEHGLRRLKVFISPLAIAEDRNLISSERIRMGEIDRNGKLYVKQEWLEKNLQIADELREELKKPFGELYLNAPALSADHGLVVTVGDVTTKFFNESSFGQKISVVDFKVGREEKFKDISELGFLGKEKVIKVDNPAGHITADLFKKLKEIFKSDVEKNIVLIVNGEDDLAVLPLILLSPLNTIIYYGQPEKGIVKVDVTEAAKDQAYSLVNQFQVSS